ncbi:MAG: hypothetical protein U9R36_03370 [Elusimicrobiota bacterium]|nr:hypothetical protein [Elusimicrobiota bacterium]
MNKKILILTVFALTAARPVLSAQPPEDKLFSDRWRDRLEAVENISGSGFDEEKR